MNVSEGSAVRELPFPKTEVLALQKQIREAIKHEKALAGVGEGWSGTLSSFCVSILPKIGPAVIGAFHA